MRLKQTMYRRNGHTKILIECEHCGYSETIWAYDDKTFWEEELPSMKCRKCKKDGGFKEWNGVAK